MKFLFFFVFILQSSLSQTYLCEQVEVIFVVDSSRSTNETYYNNNLKNFIHSVSSAFSFTDDVALGSKNHARFAIASYGDTYHFKFEFLRDETRARWNSVIDRHMVYQNFGLGAASNGLDLVEEILQISSLNLNRVVILATSTVTTDDVNNAITRYIHDLVPVVFGVGFPDVNGVNSVANDNTNMIRIAQNRSDWVYNTIDDALKASTGITAKIVEAYPCNTIQCSGFIFAVEDTYQTNSSIQTFINVVKKTLGQVPQENNGFQFTVVDDSELELFPFEPAAGLVDKMDHFWFEPVFEPTAPKLSILFGEIADVVGKKEFSKYGVVIMAETDYFQDQVATQIGASRLANSGASIFVIDMSVNPADGGSTFSTVTKNQANHIIKGVGLSEDQLYAEMQKTLIPTFAGFSC